MIISWGPNLVDIYYHYSAWASSNRIGDSLVNTAFWHQIFSDIATFNANSPFLDRVEKALLMFQLYADVSGQSSAGRPLLDVLIAPLIWIGIGASLPQALHRPGVAFVLILFITTIIFGQVLIGSVPYWPKIISVMLASSILVAIGLRVTSSAFAEIVRGVARMTTSDPHRAYRGIAAIEVLAFVGLLSVVGFREWTNFYRNASGLAGPVEKLGRLVEKLPKNVKVCGRLSPGETSINRKEIQFYGYRRELLDLTNLTLDDAIQRCSPGPLFWIVSFNQSELRDRLTQHYPHGRLTTHQGQHSILFWTFTVD
jgi:hypothetical protein